MIWILTAIHILVCFFLIIIVLLQSGKAADLAGAFGGMGSQTAFGPRGAATVLSKATTVSAVLFMITSIILSIYATRRAGLSGSVLDSQKPASAAPAPKTPALPKPLAPGSPVDVQLTPVTPDQAAPPATPTPAPASKK